MPSSKEGRKEAGSRQSRQSGGDRVEGVGQVLGSRWRLRRRVGKGTFSEIFEAADLKRQRDKNGRHPQVAVKLARDEHKRSMLQHEQEVLEDLQGPSIARYYELGCEDGCAYLVMQLLGENLSELRRLTPSKRFTLRTTALLGLQIVQGLRHMHESGYVHRDIKPSNCCIGLESEAECYLCDFGLARRWRLASGEVRERREHVEFRGTCRYASIHSHQHQELGRRDDLWSLLYMLLELHGGELPVSWAGSWAGRGTGSGAGTGRGATGEMGGELGGKLGGKRGGKRGGMRGGKLDGKLGGKLGGKPSHPIPPRPIPSHPAPSHRVTARPTPSSPTSPQFPQWHSVRDHGKVLQMKQSHDSDVSRAGPEP